jgi:hypothetical protein
MKEDPKKTGLSKISKISTKKTKKNGPKKWKICPKKKDNFLNKSFLENLKIKWIGPSKTGKRYPKK